jgi:hypothetical protein
MQRVSLLASTAMLLYTLVAMPLNAQDSKGGTGKAVSVAPQDQLYVYKDARTGTKYLGHTSDIVHGGELYKTLATALEQVTFISCEKTRLIVARKALQEVPGKCQGVLDQWAQQKAAVEGVFLGVTSDGSSATFGLRATDGTLTNFSLPKGNIVGFTPTKNSKVLFMKDPTLWGAEPASNAKILQMGDNNQKVGIIKEQSFSVFAAGK